MPCHPEEIDTTPYCVKCSRDNEENDSPLECDKVGSHYIMQMLCMLTLSANSVIVHGT